MTKTGRPVDKRKYPILELECLHCKEIKPIPQKTKSRTNICLDCSRKQAREYSAKKALAKGQRIGEQGRYPYPLQEWEYMNQKFNTLAKEMKRTESREEALELIRRNLERVLENKEVMDWIWMHDKFERNQEIEAKRKSKQNKKKLIDTRTLDWDDWDALDFGQEWDD